MPCRRIRLAQENTGVTSTNRNASLGSFKCQEFVSIFSNEGLPYSIDSPFITPVPQFWFVIPNHQKTEKSEVLAPTLQEIFTECDDKSNLIVPALDFQAQDLSVYDFLMTCYVNWLMKQAIRLRIARPL